MKSVVAISGACLVTWLIGAIFVSPGAGVELFLGMAMPLVMAVGTMALFSRKFARDPSQLTPLIVKAFGAKMVLVGGYVAIVVGLTELEPIAFIVSFTLYFISLHLTEAIQLRSLLRVR
jgi:hypothetical protein